MSAILTPLAAAIAANENVNPAYNNPGGLDYGDIGYGTFGAGLTIFPDYNTGATALNSQAQGMIDGTSSIYSPDESIESAAETYTGGNTTAGTNWANALGTSTSTTLGSLGSLTGASSVLSSITSTSPFASISKFFNAPQASLTNIVILVLGLILLIAGIFSFDKTQTIIKSVGKTAAKASEFLA